MSKREREELLRLERDWDHLEASEGPFTEQQREVIVLTAEVFSDPLDPHPLSTAYLTAKRMRMLP